MLKKVNKATEQTLLFIDRSERSLAAAQKALSDKNLNLNVVSDSANGVNYACIYGHIKMSCDDAPSLKNAHEWIGCTPAEADAMFGHSVNDMTASQRVGMLKAHVEQLYRNLVSDQ